MNRAELWTTALIYFGDMNKTSGFIFHSGSEYKALRRFTLKTLRDLGFGKHSSEEIILEECECMKTCINKMIEESDGVVDLDKLFNKAALNVVWNVTAAERFDYDDKKMENLYNFMELFMLLGKHIIGKPLGIFPSLRFIPPFRGIFKQASEGMAESREFIRKTIEAHEQTLDVDNPRDYIDKFLIASRDDPTLNKDNLLFCCLDLFIGGSETTSKSLMYALVMILRHPEVHDKVAEEIARVTGPNDRVTLEDRDKLPYTEATLNEVWRFCNVVPIPPPRKLSSPIKIGNYEIPGQTMFMTSSYSVHMDQQYWKDPETFRPERFFHEGSFRPDERNIPFGIGKRRCLGETLARMENFLFFANLMKHFSFRCVEGSDPPDTRPMAGFTNGPAPFCMKVVKNSQ